MIFIFSGCTSEKQEAQENKSLKVLFVPGVSDPFYYTMERGIRKKAAELEIELTVSRYPEVWGAEYQIQIMEEITRHEEFDLVIISPVDNEALISPLKALYDRGIEVVTVDTKIGDGNYSIPSRYSFPLSHIGTDNTLGGIEIAVHMAELTGEAGKFYINTTTKETSTTEERKEGFLEGISRFPDMEVIRVDYNDDLQNKALEQTLTTLQIEPDIKGIFATNIFSSQGVSQAVSGSGLSGTVRIAAWDASEILITALRHGEVDLVLGQKPAEIGEMAIEWGYKYLTDNTVVPKKLVSGFIFFNQSNVNDPEMAKYIYAK
ncbi:MAG: substrate-binding domain-containing protein [Spirochaetales bacterium]|nr:substrate-binding domain-containing protein [Spirochaetales bacterium]